MTACRCPNAALSVSTFVVRSISKVKNEGRNTTMVAAAIVTNEAKNASGNMTVCRHDRNEEGGSTQARARPVPWNAVSVSASTLSKISLSLGFNSTTTGNRRRQ